MNKKLEYKGVNNKLFQEYKRIVEAEGTDKNFLKNIYSHTAEQLYFKGGYDEEQIQHFFREQIYMELTPNYYEDETYYTEFANIDEYIDHLFDDMDKEQERTIQDNTEFMDDLWQYIDNVNSIMNTEGDDADNTDNKEANEIIKHESNTRKIKKLLTQIAKGVPKGESTTTKVQLVDLLEVEETMFTVDFPDNKTDDGFKGKYYYINPETNSYERNTKNRLKQLFHDKYGVKLHQKKNFYYDLLDMVFTSMEEQPHIVEMENVYIDRRNYKIIPKKNDNIMFTTDRLTYTTYDTQELRLFHYDEAITLDDVLTGNIAPSFPMERIIQIFVPKTEPEHTNKLRMFLQYMGMMVIGRNPGKILLLLYDLENEMVGSKGRTTLFEIMKICFDNKFIRVGSEVFNDNFKIETYKNGRHGIFMDETDNDVFTKYHTPIKEIVNGTGTSGGAMYTREQIHVESLPFLIGSNGLPLPPLSDTALLNRIVPIELPNKFVDESMVEETTNTLPKISNLSDLIRQNVEGLGQVISVAINEFKKLDLTKSLDGQFAIPPNLDRTIQILTQNNIMLSLLQTYTKPIARGTDIVNDWVTTTDIQTTLAEAYKRATGNHMDKEVINYQKIGYMLKELYNPFIKLKENKIDRNGRYYYNITLKTYAEVQQEQNEILKVVPLGETKLYDTLQRRIYNEISNGNNTEQKLKEALQEQYNLHEITNNIEELYKMGLVEWTGNQNFID